MEYDSYDVFIKLNKQRVKVNIKVVIDEDDANPADDFDFGDKDKNEAYLKRFQSGELFMGLVSVIATALGEEGRDVLGGCHVFSNNAFDTSAFNRSVDETLDSYSMESNAIADLKRAIAEKIELLKPYIERK